MNQNLKNIQDLLQQNKNLSEADKEALLKAITDADKQWSITEFKLDRTEKVKRTTAILLEETIEELEKKRKDVEAQNKELEIESSLERVRAVAMGMRKPDDLLDICEILYAELYTLGFSELRNAMINIYEDDKTYFLNYDYAPGSGKTVTQMPYNFHPLIDKQVRETKNAGDAFNEFSFTGKELKNFRELRKNNGEQDDPKLEDTTSLHYYFYSIGNGSIGISTYSSITEDKLNLLKRFRNVFQLSYQRYTDITMAEAQARESQIQLALERVRARTMAMQNSNELPEAANLLFLQVQSLGMPAWSAGYCIWDDDKTAITLSMSSEGVLQPSLRMPLTEDPSLMHFREAYERGETFFVEEVGGVALKSHYMYLRTLPGVKETLDDIEKAGFPVPTFQIFHCAYFSKGFLLFITYEPCPESHDIFKRFAKVFEQTYTRFLDLQKAEAQAREAQIQLALERVRARTMAMQHSDELKDAAALLFQQAKALGVPAYSCGYNIWGKNEKTFTSWMSTQDGSDFNGVSNIPLTEDANFIRYVESKQKDEPFFVLELRGERMQEHYEYLKTIPEFKAYFEYAITVGFDLPETQIHHLANFSHGNLLFITLEPCPEFHDVFKRFAAVFEQTYTRFLDLQKSEAQAREAQIQLALERVRARTMAMQKSDELSETVFILFQQFKQLGENPDQATIGIINEDEWVIEYWVTMYGNQTNRVYKFPIDEPNVTNRIYKGWKEQKKSLVIDLSGRELHDFATFRESMGGAAYNAEEKKRVINVAFFSKGLINVQSNESRSAESIRLLERFAGVFEQTYTRFLDLQKAEAQAREAQVEAALERVRSRTMAMFKSEELNEIVFEFYKQMNPLGFAQWACIIALADENKGGFNEWLSPPTDRVLPECYHVPVLDHPAFEKMWSAYIDQIPYLTIEESDVEKRNWDLLYFEKTDFKKVPQAVKESILAEPKVVFSIVSMRYGLLIAVDINPIPEEMIKILGRFAKVFEQTYTRFLDLQKAEAQAREAKIEVALERTRTQSMLMQHSNELDNTLRVFHEQVLLLGIHSAFSFLWLPDEDKDRHIFWAAWAENISIDPLAKNSSTVFKSKAINYPLDRNEPATAQCLVDWKSNEPVYSYHVPPPAVENYFAAWQELIEGVEQLKPEYFSGGLYYVEAFMKYGCFGVMVATDLTEDEKKILGRFAIEFERTYTRFLDLQKAEAQARESQVQLAMERVRARTMAMQHSDELAEAASLLFKQIADLGTKQWSSGFDIWNSNEVSAVAWMSNPDGSMGKPFTVPYTEDTFFKLIYEARQSGKDFFVMESSGKELEETYHYMFNLPGVKKYFDDALDSGFAIPKFQITHCAFFAQGYVMFITYEPVPEAWDIFKRFAKVFEQTYTRFLDLQKAEAQAREAQIQLAMERVRARTMAMHHSSELADTATILFQQIKELGYEMWSCGFGIWKPEVDLEEAWMSTGDLFPIILLPFKEDPSHLSIYEASRRGESVYEAEVKGEVLTRHYDWLMSQPSFKIVFGQIENSGITLPAVQWKYAAFFKQGYLHFITTKPQPNIHDISRRFAKVFEQTYTRFLDLQKAEEQAREAEIELGLERVRARAMAMQSSGELSDLVDTVFKELTKLDFALTWCIINIIDESSKSNTVWAANPDINKAPESYHMLFEDYPFHHAMMKGWKERKTKYVYTLEGSEKKIYDDYLFSETEFKRTPEEAQAASRAMEKYVVSFSFSNFGGLQTVGDAPLSDANLDILARFGKVFDLTYTRFNDLKQAETQARESQIQLALERVRARTMAMQRSDELVEAAALLFKQVQSFGVPAFTCGFNIWEADDISVTSWMANPDGTLGWTPLRLPHTEHPHFIQSYEAMKRGEEFFVLESGGKELEDTYRYMFSIPEWKDRFGDFEDSGFPVPTFQISHYAFFSQGYLLFITYEPLPEMWDLFKRFAKVFEQTYTRFLDLQKAESQAREAKIEAALEKVRSRSLAMHKSDELSEVVAVVFEKLLELDFSIDGAAFIIIYIEDSKDSNVWLAGNDQLYPTSFRLPYNESPPIKDFWIAKESGVDFFSKTYSFEEKNQWFKYAFEHTDFKNLAAELKSWILEQEYLTQSAALAKNSLIGIHFHHQKLLSEKEVEILKRFSKVFDQAYVRFLDLQQAEAQAREAQIQLAMERVRARTMAMQKSEELGDISFELVKQVQSLGVATLACAFNIYDEDQNSSTEWGSNAEGYYPKYKTPRVGIFLRYYEIGQTGETLHTEVIGEDKSADHYAFLCTLPGVGDQLVKLRDSGISFPTSQIDNVAYFKYGYLLFISYEPVPEAHDIFKRFAKVFEQAYTRFLDLQTAEAQARESQIQLALERVRARTMAMQRSDELADAASLLFKQLEDLCIKSWSSGFNIWQNDGRSATINMCNPDGSITTPYYLPHTEDIFFIRICEARKRGEDLLVMETGGKELEDTYNYMFGLPEVRKVLGAMEDTGFQIPKFQVNHCAFFSQGYLMFITYEPVPEMWDIFKRFAKVFEQTYTRFLDLQKSEAQAKESQIQLALERVRARTMAMQHSDELREVIQLIYQQLLQLNFSISNSGFGIDYMETDDFNLWMADAYTEFPTRINIPYINHPQMNCFKEAKKKGLDFLTNTLTFDEKNQWFKYLFENVVKVTEETKEIVYNCKGLATSAALMKNVFLYLLNFDGTPYSDADNAILMRFGKVFEQTYTRFLDLQKAEAQAREAQIETALERVRSRSMGMQKSEELKEVIQVVYEQFVHLNIHVEHTGFIMDYKTRDDMHIWLADKHEVPSEITIPYFDSPHWNSFIKAKEKGEDFFANYLTFEEKNKFYQDLFKLFPVPDEAKEYYFNCLGLAGSTVLLDNVGLYIENFSGIPYTDEENNTLMRFGKVFQQTYTRFNDLQKAEAQAREAQIELGLERVRARAMAMQKSDELSELVDTVFKELTKLDFALTWCIINIIDESSMSNTVWAANPDINKAPESYHMLFEDYPFHHAMMKGWKERMTKYVYTLEGSEKKVYDEYLFNETEFRKVPQAAQAASRAMEKYVVTFSFSNFGGLQTVGDAPLSDANLDILSRFGKVFDLTYTRFNDLKQAEAQAREAQIEAALERVRSRTMAMQRSQELMQAAELLFQQVQSLGVTLWGCSFNFWETGDTEFTCYWGSPDSAKYSTWKIPLMEEARFIHFHESRQRGDEFWYEEISGEEIKAHYRYMLTIPGLGEDLKKMLEAGFAFPTFQINHLVNFSHGNLIFITYQPVPEAHDIFKRFGKVFEQTYTRFLDLQKAEEQARESQIEAALERVRSRSMGMQKSEELRDVIQVIYEQLLHLNFNIDSAGFAMDYRDSDDWNLWMVDRNGPYPNLLHIPYFDHPMANAIIESKKNGDELLVISLTFEEKNKLWDQFFKYVTVPEEAKEALYSSPGFFMSKALFRNVDLFIQNYTGISCSDAENATLIRFGKVFEQTYIRFNDLKQAEAQALEAIKRASVDRVRAEIASMRTTTDLERITPLIWNELTTLGVPFIRCGVFIMDEEQQQVQTLLSTPDGKAIATLHVPFEFNLSIITNGVHYWRKKKVYTEHWDAAAFTKAWVALSSLRETSMDSPQTEHPPENLYLHMLPFLQGMLYVGNDAPLNEDELHLVQNLADAFATAYARYEDFNKLESANIKIEKTLVDLKQTQAQLVQSEKMASLGELTAGIAHEIQNPLNFVNNFSEVSKELLDEMKEELDKGNTADAKEIAEDVIQNLEKINHHGKRADAIVKGMLQHSRSSTGVKEPTDINALTDEYLRLAFHGLRAKDKSFNANIKTDYDETIGKINIIPQDIGRVLLNLYNNAFYAVTERKKQQPENYEPTVSVSSKKIGDKVILTVTDNGNGIPQKVIDKIFQPFFTTKPTGEGTGLGLSLSYDIMKAHGGDIKVETKEGEGSEFIIMLPVV